MRKLIAFLVGTSVALALAVPVYALGIGIGAEARVVTAKPIDIACVQKAVDQREDALIAGWAAFHTSMSGAYATRKAALHDAWGKSDPKERKAAVKTAWETFKKAAKDAHKTWKGTRKSAWKMFRSAVKACRGAMSEASVELSGEAADND